MNLRKLQILSGLIVLIALAGCDRQASRLASEHGLRYARSFHERLQYMNTAIEMDPENTMAFVLRGNAHSQLGSYEQAIKDLKRGIELDTQHEYPIETYNNLAWLMATCTEAEFRNGEEAVKYATKACEYTGWENGNIIDTLAAAYAEDGQFEKAVMWQEKAIELGDMSNQFIYVQFKQRLEMYLHEEPYRE